MGRVTKDSVVLGVVLCGKGETAGLEVRDGSQILMIGGITCAHTIKRCTSGEVKIPMISTLAYSPGCDKWANVEGCRSSQVELVGVGR